MKEIYQIKEISNRLRCNCCREEYEDNCQIDLLDMKTPYQLVDILVDEFEQSSDYHIESLFYTDDNDNIIYGFEYLRISGHTIFHLFGQKWLIFTDDYQNMPKARLKEEISELIDLMNVRNQ